MGECTCFPTPPSMHTTHYGAIEPASALEPNPECREHFRKPPHRLTDGTWSDGIDRSEPLGTRDMHYNRWEVWKNDWRQWLVAVSYPPLSYLEDVEREFPTHTEAIAYADHMARTNQGENNGR